MTQASDGWKTALSERYRIDRLIGEGAAACVYAARDLKHGRDVAVKVLRSELVQEIVSPRFLREIQIAAQLSHPHILPLFDSGEVDGIPYFVMPLIAGETLRDRLEREGALPLEVALSIMRQVAAALEHAHERGVVHRDIKPENILLVGREAMVADFGIAVAFDQRATAERITAAGVVVGTPRYMSPEQAAGERNIDARSDLYALGCVAYEMLTGNPPFTGKDARAVAVSHAFDTPPSPRAKRREVPVAVDRAVRAVMAKNPADRLPTARAFIDALSTPLPRRAVPARRRPMVYWGIAVAAVAIAGASLKTASDIRLTRAIAAADTMHWVLLPSAATTTGGESPVDAGLRRAIASWSGIMVEDAIAVHEAAGRGTSALSVTDAQRTALQLGAGRFVRVSAAPVGAGTRVHAALFDAARPATALAAFDADLPREAAPDSALALLAERLVFREADEARLAQTARGTRSVPARQALHRGLAHLDAWSLDAADSAFAVALRADEKYASAALWLALSKAWRLKRTPEWTWAVQRAGANDVRLAPRERAMLAALRFTAAGDRPAACTAWRALAASDRFDFSSAYSAALCLARDNAVLADARSPSGWRFRSGYHTALLYYRQAFELRPSVLRALRDDGFREVRSLLKTSGNDVRFGMVAEAPDRPFAANAALINDTLAYIPIPMGEYVSIDATTAGKLSRNTPSAVRRQRQLFRDIAATWAAVDPRSAEAREALALSLFLIGDPFALDTLARARALVGTARDAQRLAGTDVWMRVQLALPDDRRALRRARLVADSLLADDEAASGDPHMLASLAALTGRARRAVELERLSPGATLRPEAAPLASSARALLVSAAMGASRDSLLAAEQRLLAEIESKVPPEKRSTVRAEVLGRAAGVAIPMAALQVLTVDSAIATSTLLRAERAWLRGDTAAMLRELDKPLAVRRLLTPGDLTLDALLPEAWLLASAGRVSAAAERLDPTLGAVGTMQLLMDPVQAASLVRAMALRADLAARAGDGATAARWAAAVVDMWSDADLPLQPLVARMRRLTAARPP